jgi:hypothetical protein
VSVRRLLTGIGGPESRAMWPGRPVADGAAAR